MSTRHAPHVPVVDTELPPDHNGHEVCRCGLIIRRGDPRHTLPDVPEQAEARRWAGEREDDD